MTVFDTLQKDLDDYSPGDTTQLDLLLLLKSRIDIFILDVTNLD